ncbi:Uncharacterised protein [Providencia alcalifaciens]|uniref:Uncharacterized protein n=1 Tax=Providencia alcalifaciens DSM 30120 TaxID=520999 RepID=B6XGR4_9GAMM|nr:hypothetical protein [Providencia alcalifaciens]EEB45461.1 hypothetical protein PROVALCAL_02550 [Providencia alcalifaciens DSM 30120]SQI34769.1 Uncharacterised protein [Providencia alcalifaciens]
MEFEGSKTPWRIGSHPFEYRNRHTIRSADNAVIAHVSQPSDGQQAVMADADTRLIAAAPELLEALIELVQSYDKCSIDHNGLCQEHFLQEANDCTFKKANLAIAKALGQQ